MIIYYGKLPKIKEYLEKKRKKNIDTGLKKGSEISQ